MLKDYPTIINNIQLFPPDKWEETSEVVEETYQTEAGTDQASVTRYDKLAVDAQYRVNSEWLKQFKMWAKVDSLDVSIYDATANGYTHRVMRIRDFKASPVEWSERMKDTDGIWNISFSLEEF